MPTSWKLWAVLLVLGLAGIAVAVSIPAYRRLQALRYFDAHDATYELSPDDAWITERLGEWATGLRRVESVDLKFVSDEALIHVSQFRELKELKLPGYRPREREQVGPALSALAAQSLGRLRELKSLSIRGSNFNDDVIAHLLDSPPLQFVRIRDAGVLRLALVELSEIPTINELHISSCEVVDDDFVGLEPLPHLTKLSVGPIGEHGLEWLSQCNELEHLSISRMTVTPETMRAIARLPGLKWLEFDRCEGVDAQSLSLLMTLPHLTQLELPMSVIDSDALGVFDQFPVLSEVHINRGRFSSDDLKRLNEQLTECRVRSLLFEEIVASERSIRRSHRP